MHSQCPSTTVVDWPFESYVPGHAIREGLSEQPLPLANNMMQGQIRRLNTPARTDFAWWQIMLNNWFSTSIHQFLLLQELSHHLYSDASGSWGCGTFSLPLWLQFAWPRENPLHSIALKELFPIVLACLVWGHQWAGTYVLCHCDNVAAVCQVHRLFARDPIAAHLLHCLAQSMALFDFRIRAVHIARMHEYRC